MTTAEDKAPLPLAETNYAKFLPLTHHTYPSPPVPTASNALAAQIETAKERVRRRNVEHVEAKVHLDIAREQRAQAPDSDTTRDVLTRARQAYDAAGEDLEAAKEALALVTQRVQDAVSSGKAAAFDAHDKAQGAEAFHAGLAPLVTRTTKLGHELGVIVGEAKAFLDTINAARHQANLLARELGISNYRAASLDISDAARAIGLALRAGFKASGQKDIEIHGWVRGA